MSIPLSTASGTALNVTDSPKVQTSVAEQFEKCNYLKMSGEHG